MTLSDTSGRGWARTGLVLGGLVSIAANIAHSYIPPTGAATDWHPQAGAVVGAICWPVFLFIAIEILARVTWPHGFWYAALRFGGMLPVAAVAALVSYRHLSGLLAYYGEEPLVYHLGPLAVDGLMVMATTALLAINTHTGPTAAPVTTPVDSSVNPTAETEEPTVPTLVPVAIEAPLPTNLLPVARFTATNHQHTTGRTITADELAERLQIAPTVAGRLLATLDNEQHTNGHAPAAVTR